MEEDDILTLSGSSLRHYLEKLDLEILHPIIMKKSQQYISTQKVTLVKKIR